MNVRKVVSWNVNSLKARSWMVNKMLTETQPDILFVQESKSSDKTVLDLPEGYEYVLHHGAKGKAGVGAVYRSGLKFSSQEIQLVPDDRDSPGRVQTFHCNGTIFINTYVPNGVHPESDRYQFKLVWLYELHEFLKTFRKERVVLMGDFNIVPTEKDAWNSDLWNSERILCTPKERAAFHQIMLTHKLHDLSDRKWTWVDYHNFFKTQWKTGLRIDFMLVNSNFRKVYEVRHKTLQQYRLDSLLDEHNKRVIPSDHTAVMLQLRERK